MSTEVEQHERNIQELTDHLELIKADLKWQLSFEEIDWDHFGEFVKSAKVICDNIKKLKLVDQDGLDDFVRPIATALAQSAAETLDEEIMAETEQYKEAERDANEYNMLSLTLRKANYIDLYEGIRKRICPNEWECRFSLMEEGDAFSIESKDHASNFIEEIWAIILGPSQLEFKLVYCLDDGTKTTRGFVYSGRYTVGWMNE